MSENRSTLDRGFFNKFQCGACGAQLYNLGAMGNHIRYHPDCTFEKRFWGRVEKRADGCWIYHGAKKHDGYGLLCIDGKMTQAHRLSWEMVNGPIPAGQCALHHCDNPPCVNPEHLFLGDRKANTADRIAKGRSLVTRAKLQPDQVVEIRRAYQRTHGPGKGRSNAAELASRYGVGKQAISNIGLGHTWKHLK